MPRQSFIRPFEPPSSGGRGKRPVASNFSGMVGTAATAVRLEFEPRMLTTSEVLLFRLRTWAVSRALTPLTSGLTTGGTLLGASASAVAVGARRAITTAPCGSSTDTTSSIATRSRPACWKTCWDSAAGATMSCTTCGSPISSPAGHPSPNAARSRSAKSADIWLTSSVPLRRASGASAFPTRLLFVWRSFAAGAAVQDAGPDTAPPHPDFPTGVRGASPRGVGFRPRISYRTGRRKWRYLSQASSPGSTYSRAGLETPRTTLAGAARPGIPPNLSARQNHGGKGGRLKIGRLELSDQRASLLRRRLNLPLRAVPEPSSSFTGAPPSKYSVTPRVRPLDRGFRRSPAATGATTSPSRRLRHHASPTRHRSTWNVDLSASAPHAILATLRGRPADRQRTPKSFRSPRHGQTRPPAAPFARKTTKVESGLIIRPAPARRASPERPSPSSANERQKRLIHKTDYVSVCQ